MASTRASKSPLTPVTNTIYRMPDRDVGEQFTIRVGGTIGAGDVVLFAIGHEPSTTDCDGFLTNGESFSFDDGQIVNTNEVYVVATTGTPPIYYFGK